MNYKSLYKELGILNEIKRAGIWASHLQSTIDERITKREYQVEEGQKIDQ